MQLTAKLIQLLPIQTGTGKSGEWKKQDILVETLDQYPKKICISVWGDKIIPELLKVDTILCIDFDIESREFSGKWYTNLKAWRIDLAHTGGGNANNISDQIKNTLMDDEDVLPF